MSSGSFKVSYLNEWGGTSKAYLDEPALEDGSYVGTNKHSDEPVRLRWDGELWVEVTSK